MKAIDILKKAEKIENNWILIEAEKKDEYGVAIKLTGDPCIRIAYIESDSDGEVKIGNKKYRIEKSIYIDIKNIDKLKQAIDTLLDMEI